MAPQTFLLVCIAALVLFFAGHFLLRACRALRIERLYRKPLSRHQLNLIAENVTLYNKVPEVLRQELHGKIQIFLANKEFVGCDGLEISDEVRLTIAANACILLLNKEKECFPKFRTILIYPDTYHVPGIAVDGEVHTSYTTRRAGESWMKGPVVLSWGDTIRGSQNAEDGFNVVLHEFAHKLDEQNAVMDGLPILNSRKDYSDWAKVLNKEYSSFLQRAVRGKNRVIDSYGATSPVEFFAVATESFFEKPQQMRKRLPDLYKQLSRYYQLDTAEW